MSRAERTDDRATGFVSLFDKELNRDILRNAEIAAVEERGGNYIGVEPATGRAIPAVVDNIKVEKNNRVRFVIRLDLRIADLPIIQRLTLYHELKRPDIENTVDWKPGRLFRVEQLLPIAQNKPDLNTASPSAPTPPRTPCPTLPPTNQTRSAWKTGGARAISRIGFVPTKTDGV